MKQLPNLLTLLNLVFGCCAIVFMLQNGIQIVAADPSPENPLGQRLEFAPASVYMAPLFILLAAVADFFDGFAARLVGASSEMGKQLDSLADVVSFGVAPSVIIYQFLRLSYAGREDGLSVNMFWLIPAFVLAAAAAYRLAKFNLDTRASHYFRGTPVPSVGLAVAGFPLIWWHNNNSNAQLVLSNPYFWYAVIALLSYLMVSDLPVMSNKPKSFTVSHLLPHILLLTLTIVAAVLFGWWAAPLSYVFFVLLSVLFKNKIV